MSSFCVIGSGISGATIANLLSKKYSVDLFDKARGPGGRSSFKRLDKAKGFDHGTQYISPKSTPFKKFIKQLIKKKILKKWTGKHLFLKVPAGPAGSKADPISAPETPSGALRAPAGASGTHQGRKVKILQILEENTCF